MAVSKLIVPIKSRVEIMQNGWGATIHLRLLQGAFVPTAALATWADASASECVHAQYSPQNISLTYDETGGILRLTPTDAVFNSGAPTTLSAKYGVLLKGNAASISSSSKILGWFDGNVAQLTAASASAANPAVVTSVAHGLSNGNTVCCAASPNRDLVGQIYTVAAVTADTFQLTGLDLSAAGSATLMDLIKLNNATEAAAAADIFRVESSRLLKW